MQSLVVVEADPLEQFVFGVIFGCSGRGEREHVLFVFLLASLLQERSERVE